jgi:hypothetical protein
MCDTVFRQRRTEMGLRLSRPFSPCAEMASSLHCTTDGGKKRLLPIIDVIQLKAAAHSKDEGTS